MPPQPHPMKSPDHWRTWISLAVLAVTAALMVAGDVRSLRAVKAISGQGGQPPARVATSETGYAEGQRQFLGTHERGETFQWIALVQRWVAAGPFASPRYDSDNAPEGRPQLKPKLYAAWLLTIAWSTSLLTGEPLAIAVESAALIEPVAAHGLILLLVVVFTWRRFGSSAAAGTGVFFALFPLFTGQFIPGVLTPRTGALCLAAYALALNFPAGRTSPAGAGISVRGAWATGAALALDPAIGFPSVLITAVVSIVLTHGRRGIFPYLKWSLWGASVTLTTWLIDQAPWAPAAGELRYVHPAYALTWLGVGLALAADQQWRTPGRSRKIAISQFLLALPLLGVLPYLQFQHGYKAWLYPSSPLRRLTSLDETRVAPHAFKWIGSASFMEVALISAPLLVALGLLLARYVRARRAREADPAQWIAPAVALAGLLVLTFFRIRWSVVASLAAMPVFCELIAQGAPVYRRALVGSLTVYAAGLLFWVTGLPASLQRPVRGAELQPADLDALVYRHFSHWLASHYPGQKVTALAPPDLSDSLIFHGGRRTLLSSAWEAYPGQVAAARILGALEASEAEAVLTAREVTHMILPSWDPVFPLLVQKAGPKETLHARLQRWVYPRFLRPLPYQLPPLPGYLDQKLVVFKVIPPEDEALSMSRLAEYFVEMKRTEPAKLVAGVLTESYPDDPNAILARALVDLETENKTGFDRELARIVNAVPAGPASLSWDRRIQRAIVLALGRRHELARAEIESSLATATSEAVFELTPLQAHRLRTLLKSYRLTAPNHDLGGWLDTLGAEYNTVASANSGRR